MASLIEPLNSNVPITNADGTPTPLLQRLLQKLQLNSGSGLTVTGGKLAIAAIPTKTLLANPSGATAIPTSATLSQVLDFLGTTQGSILYRDSTGWQILAPGTSGQFLKTQGAGANPIWAAGGGGGGGTTPTIRSSNIASYNASSATITFPTGTVAGDIVVIYWENGFAGNYSAPSGWTPIHLAPNVGNYTNQNCAAKIMTSADITAGSVVVNAAGSFNGITAAITITGTTVTSFDHSDAYDSSGSTSIASASVTGMLGVASTDLIVGFASTRAADTLTVSSNMTILQTINAASASGIVFSIAAAGITKLGLLETITAHTSNNGLTWTTLAFR